MTYIFLHGLGQVPSTWDNVINDLDDDYDIVCPNLFQLVENKDINYSHLYDEFSKYCHKYSKPLNICGLSLGGILALQYAIENPDYINSLVLIGTQYTMPKKILRFQNIIFRFLPTHTFNETGITKKDIISLTQSMMDLDFHKDLQKINFPVLIVCGKKDKANMKASLKLKELIPCAKLKIIEDAGHEVNEMKPKELAKILNEFYKR